jgi:hypothetical protein
MKSSFIGHSLTPNDTDLAAAVSWPPVTLDATPKVMCARLIAAANQSDATNMAAIETRDQHRRVHVVTDGAKVKATRISFTQRLNKSNADSLTIKGTIDLRQYPQFTDLRNTDISLYVADYLAVIATNTPVLNKRYMQRFKLSGGVFGNRVALFYLSTTKFLSFQFSVSKTSIANITCLGATSEPHDTIYLPVGIVITGSSSTDTVKGGQSWIIAQCFPVEYNKGPNQIKGRF